MIELRSYTTSDGCCPFDRWMASLRGTTIRARIDARLARLRTGNFGDSKFVGGGVHELRLNFGPGYRINFGRHGSNLVILLAGGDKHRQSSDITRAQAFWRAYLEEHRHAHD